MPKFPNTAPWREWLVAAKANAPQDKDNKCDAIRAVQASVMNSNENDWLRSTKSVFECYASLTPQNVTDVATWLKGLMQTKAWNIATTCLVVMRIHKLVEGAVGLAERTRVATFLTDLEAAGVAKAHAQTFLVKLFEKDVKKSLLPGLMANDFLGIQKTKLTTICGATGGTVPDWLCKALVHVTKVQAGTFWLRDTNDSARINSVGALVYAGDWWKEGNHENAAIANEYAKNKVADNHDVFSKMFNLTEWKDVSAEAKEQDVDDPEIALIAIGRARSDESAVQGELGTWIVEHREAVLGLIKHGYLAAVIAEMHAQELEHREILAMTWFRGTPATAANAANHLDVAFKAGEAHGFYWGRTQHLAERHLYKHFQFDAQPKWAGDDAIKARNSFHPRGTTQQNLAALHNDIKLPANADGELTIGGYIIAADRPNTRIKTLYPDIATNHVDFYWKADLDKMKKVAAKFAVAYKNALPEIEWFDAPR